MKKIVWIFIFIVTISLQLFSQGQGSKCQYCPPSPIGNGGKILGSNGSILNWVAPPNVGQLSIGNSVLDSIPNGVLYVNGGGVLAQDTNFLRTPLSTKIGIETGQYGFMGYTTNNISGIWGQNLIQHNQTEQAFIGTTNDNTVTPANMNILMGVSTLDYTYGAFVLISHDTINNTYTYNNVGNDTTGGYYQNNLHSSGIAEMEKGNSITQNSTDFHLEDTKVTLKSSTLYNDNTFIIDTLFSTLSQSLGIGTTNPQAMLDVHGTIKIVDGTQGVNKLLTSDANGLASWQTLGSGLNTYTTPTLAHNDLGAGKPYILNTSIGGVAVLLLAITP